jgi:hypothetical protein
MKGSPVRIWASALYPTAPKVWVKTIRSAHESRRRALHDPGVYGVLLLISWIAAVVVATKIGAKKNRAGWAWGLFLGWLGVAIVACLSPRRAY